VRTNVYTQGAVFLMRGRGILADTPEWPVVDGARRGYLVSVDFMKSISRSSVKGEKNHQVTECRCSAMSFLVSISLGILIRSSSFPLSSQSLLFPLPFQSIQKVCSTRVALLALAIFV
jgi:hypothetical protein